MARKNPNWRAMTNAQVALVMVDRDPHQDAKIGLQYRSNEDQLEIACMVRILLLARLSTQRAEGANLSASDLETLESLEQNVPGEISRAGLSMQDLVEKLDEASLPPMPDTEDPAQ